MLKISLISTITILSSLSHAAVFENCTQGVSFNNGNTYKHISGKVVCHLRDNPTVKTREIGLYKGIKQGKSIFYDASLSTIRDQDKTGKLYRIEHYSQGKLDGEVRHFDPRTGKMKEFMRYKNGHTVYSKNMNDNSERFYAFPITGEFWSRSGSMDTNAKGQITSLSCPQKKSDHNLINVKCGWSYSPGPVVKLHYGPTVHEMRYCKGKRCKNSPSKSTSRSGKKTGESFVNKKEQRVERQFYQNGKVKYEHISNKGRGAENIIREYFESGKPKSIAIIRDRKTQELTKFYQNGKKRYNGKILGRIVKAIHYYDNGKKSEEYEFKTYPRVFYNRFITRGKIINISRGYYESGRLSREVTWKDGYQARVRSFDVDGKLEKDESYYSDGSRK